MLTGITLDEKDKSTVRVSYLVGEPVPIHRFMPAGNIFYLVTDDISIDEDTYISENLIVVCVVDSSIYTYEGNVSYAQHRTVVRYNDFAKYISAVVKRSTVLLIADVKSRAYTERFLVHRMLSCYDGQAKLYPAFVKNGELYAGYSELPGNLVPFNSAQVRKLVELGKIRDVVVSGNDIVLYNPRPTFDKEGQTFIFNVYDRLCMMSNHTFKDFIFSALSDYPDVVSSYNNGTRIYMLTLETLKVFIEGRDLQGVNVIVNCDSECSSAVNELFTPQVDVIREYFVKYNIPPENASSELDRLRSLFGSDSDNELCAAIKNTLL